MSADAGAGAGDTGSGELKRSVGLTQLVLYGLGTTIGAGIYVLVGPAAGYAGAQAPLAFLVAALVIAPTAGSFAELSARFPVSAGEAAYVEHAFAAPVLSLAVGVLVMAIGIISSATLAQGAVGYLGAFVDVPRDAVVVAIVFGLGAVAIWGISQSMLLAGLFTLVDISGLVLVIGAGLQSSAVPVAAIAETLTPAWSGEAAAGLAAATILGFFAFLGFEDIVNVAEETHAPRRTVPMAIGITLVVTTLLYVAVAAVAVTVVPAGELARAEAPLALAFERTGAGSGRLVAAIAVGATLNGILIQMIMASRVAYGLARLGRLPGVMARVSRRTRTPVVATACIIAVVITLALSLPLLRLAEVTSTAALATFVAINAALIRLKLAGGPAPAVRVPGVVPWLGFMLCLGFLVIQLARVAGF